jgi:hypothetical protein
MGGICAVERASTQVVTLRFEGACFAALEKARRAFEPRGPPREGKFVAAFVRSFWSTFMLLDRMEYMAATAEAQVCECAWRVGRQEGQWHCQETKPVTVSNTA